MRRKSLSEKRAIAGAMGGAATVARYGKKHMGKLGGGRPGFFESVARAWAEWNGSQV